MLDSYLVQGLDIDIRFANPGPWQDLFECSDLSMAEQYIITEITATIINTKGSQSQVYTSADHKHWIMIFDGLHTTHYRIVPRTLKKVKPINEVFVEKVDIPEFLKEFGPDGYKYNTQKNEHETPCDFAEKVMKEMCNEADMWYKAAEIHQCIPDIPWSEAAMKAYSDLKIKRQIIKENESK